MSMIKKIQGLKSNSGAIKYLKNTSWLLCEKVIRLTVGLFVSVWVARYLGPESFGAFSYAQSFVALFSTIAMLGLNGIVTRELVKSKDLKDKLLGTAFILKIIGSAIVLTLLYITLLFDINDNQTNFFIFIIASSTIFQSFNVIDFYFQSQVLSRYVVYSNLITLIFSSIIKVLLILNDAPLIAFVYVVLLDSIVLMLGFIYFYLKTNHSIKKWSFDYQLAFSLLKDSWPLILSGVVVTIYMKIDQVMIKQMLDSESVGQYAAAVRLSEAWYFIPMIICSSLFPAIINAKTVSDELYKSRCQNLYDLMVFLSVSVAIFMTFFSSYLVEILYGLEYQEASSILVIHIWAGVFAFLGVANGRWVITENLVVNGMIRTTLGAIVNVTLNVLLIEKYGIKGAAISTLISYFLANYFTMILFRETRECFWQQTKAFDFIRIGKKICSLKN